MVTGDCVRSPNHLATKEVCRAAVPLLAARHGLGSVVSLRLDENGWVNPCFFLNEDFVLRFNARDPEAPKFQREKFVFSLLQDSPIPTPKWFHLDSSREFVPYDVFITRMLPGANVEAQWPSLKERARDDVAADAGRWLSELHRQRFDFFGELANQGPLPRTRTWFEYLEARLESHLHQSGRFHIFDSATEKRFRLALQDRRAVFESVTEAGLVHMDYHLGNLLHQHLKVTAVLDFEWAFAGDPLYDLGRWVHGEDWPGSRAGFLRGYGRNGFSDLELSRIEIYQMLQNIELCPVAAEHFPVDEAQSYRKTTLEQFERITCKPR